MSNVGKFTATVSHSVQPETGHRVNVLASLVVVQKDAFTLLDHQQSVVGSEVGVRLGRNPEVFERLLSKSGLGLRGHSTSCHAMGCLTG